ncbi:MAG TPA: hypothetical protein VF789_09205 [Thermoanaerobaculia bacterium]
MRQRKTSAVALGFLLACGWTVGAHAQTPSADACKLAAGPAAQQGSTPPKPAIELDPLANATEVSTCTAPCGDGIHTVSCTATSCQAYSNYVQCNGQIYVCSGCYAYCQNDPDYFCYSHSGQCSSWFDNPTFTYWISCGGATQQCPDCGTPWCD